MKKILLITCLFLPALAYAQQGQTGVNGLSFIAPLQLAGGGDNGFLVDRTNPNERLLVLSLPPSLQTAAPNILPQRLSDNVFTVRLPKAAFVNDSRRHEFTATYVPEFEVFRKNGDQNTMNQQATGLFRYFFARNAEFSVSDVYRSSHDPARTLENVFLLLPRSPYSENAVRASFDFQPNRVTSFGVQYDYTRTNFGQTDPFQVRILDSASAGYSFMATRMLSRTQRLRFTYSLFKITAINPHSKFEDQVDTNYSFEQPMHGGLVEYRASPTPGTVVELAAGLIKMNTGLNYTFRVGIDKRVGSYYWIGGGYSRSLSFQTAASAPVAAGLNSNGFYDVFTARFKGQTTRKTAVLFDVTMSRGVASPLIDSSKSFMGRARFDYRLGDREVLFTSLESFNQNNNAYVRAPLSRNRLMVGFEISLSSETDRRLNHSNEDAEYVALTDHQRHNTKPQ